MSTLEAVRVKERPILFSGSMVRAILAGKKSQTRRVVNPQPTVSLEEERVLSEAWDAGFITAKCPYGSRGDRLWVRETFALEDDTEYFGENMPTDGRPVKDCSTEDGEELWHLIPRYRSTEPDTWLMIRESDEPENSMVWTPSIFMPRWASRISLEITNVRIERLRDITESDARAEGITDGGCLNCGNPEPCGCNSPCPDARDAYVRLWNSINEKRGFGWAENPWVWVVEFRLSSPAAIVPDPTTASDAARNA